MSTDGSCRVQGGSLGGLRAGAQLQVGLSAEALQNGYDRLGQLAERIAAVMEEWERASAQLQELGEAV